jgi:hypothetical protein
MDALRLADRNVGADAASLDLTPIVGNWINTETRTQWIRRLDVHEDGDRLLVDLEGAQPWPARKAEAVYAATIQGVEASGFRVVFEDAEIQATLNQGLMVLVTFNDGAAKRVTREFFARTGAGA